MRIPGNHACTLHYVTQFGLKIRPFVNYNSNVFLRLRDSTVRLSEYRSASGWYNLGGAEAGRDPQRLLEIEMETRVTRTFSEEKYQLFYARTPGIVDEYDRRTLRQHLEAGLLTDEAIEFMGHSTGLIQYERASFLETLIDYFGLLRVDQFELVDGMDSLTTALVQQLGDSLRLNTCVKAVESRPTASV